MPPPHRTPQSGVCPLKVKLFLVGYSGFWLFTRVCDELVWITAKAADGNGRWQVGPVCLALGKLIV